MGESESWYQGIPGEHRELVDELTRLVSWGVHVSGSVNPEFCDAVFERCSIALLTDPRLLDFVGSVHRIADFETNREFEAHGPTTKARLWAQLGDRLRGLTGRDALGGD